jgi:hypothetical protein
LIASAHEHLLIILGELRDREMLDVQLLIKKLQSTVQFESDLETFYSKASAQPVMYFEEEAEEGLDPNSYKAIQKKYQQQAKMAEAAKALAARQRIVGDRKRKGSVAEKDKQTLVFKGLVSKAFAPFMNYYVELERKGFDAIIDNLRTEEDWFGEREEKDAEERLQGSDKVLLFVQRSKKRVSDIDKRKLFFDIIQVIVSFFIFCFSYFSPGIQVWISGLRGALIIQNSSSGKSS